MIRSICQYETNREKCSKVSRSRKSQQFCREHYKLVKHEARPIGRVRKVKAVRGKSEPVVMKGKKKK